MHLAVCRILSVCFVELFYHLSLLFRAQYLKQADWSLWIGSGAFKQRDVVLLQMYDGVERIKARVEMKFNYQRIAFLFAAEFYFEFIRAGVHLQQHYIALLESAAAD